MASYATRRDSMTQATGTYAAVDTKADGSTGPVRVPSGRSKIVQLITSVVVDGASVADTGNNYIVEIGGDGAPGGPHEIVVGGTSMGSEGTAVDGSRYSQGVSIIPCDIDIVQGNDINLRAAYTGTDPGSPEIAVTVVMQ